MLDEAYDEHDSEVRQLRIDRVFDPVRSDPRFKAMLKKTGFDK